MRLTRRVVAPERLAFVDVVLSTHAHGDHLDEETLRAIGAPVVAPAGTVELARERSGTDVRGLSEGESARLGGFRIEAVPGSAPGRSLRRLCRSQPGRSASTTPGTRPGSTRACGGVDLAFVPINGKLDNLDGPEAARLAHHVRAALAVPCHYDMFEFNTASPARFVAECNRLGQPYRVLENGERVSLPAHA